MSKQPNTNLKAIELTQSELDSVTGGSGISGIVRQLQAQQALLSLRAINNALNSSIKGVGAAVKNAAR